MNTVITAIAVVAGFALFAWLARRLLGVRYLSVTRTLLSGVIGIALGGLFAGILVRRGVDRDSALISGIVLGVVFTMVAIIAFELVARPGRRTPRPQLRVPRPVQSVRRQWTLSRRMAEVTRIAAKHGLAARTADQELESSPAALGRRVRLALEEAGGMFVKLGQLLSTRTDIVPPEMASELAKLQTRVQAVPRSEIEPVLKDGLGASTEETFAEFDWTPLGSASIGQVYQATTLNGEAVVVKVLRPGITETVTRDAEIITRIAESVERRTSWGATYGVASLAREFADDLRRELDYGIEARHAAEIAAAVADLPEIEVPRIHGEMSTSQVLVMDRFQGTPVGDLEMQPDAFTGKRLAEALFKAEVEAMIDGHTFHSDPHPGNVMLLDSGRLGLIDFGSAGRLDAFERAAISDILLALRLRDPTLLREAALEVATVKEGTDPLQLERAFAQLMAHRLGPAMTPDADLIRDFLKIVFDFGMKPPPSVTSMFRTMGTLAGTLEILSAGFNLIGEAEKLATNQMQRWLEPESLSELAQTEVIRLAPIIQRLPRHIDRIAGQLERGELTVRSSLFSSPTDARQISRLWNRGVLAFLGAALGVVSVQLLSAPGGPALVDDLSLFDLLGYLGLFGGAILVMRVVLETLREAE